MKAWGLLLSVDLFDCDEFIIKDFALIKEFIVTLCSKIDMVRHGRVRIERFGNGDLNGVSAFQFIKTSSITLHNDEKDNRMFIDVFSCKEFDTAVVVNYAMLFFKSNKANMTIITRGERE
jgi:S-adenosylmethionine/arginine decarboxylase-like enzyme